MYCGTCSEAHKMMKCNKKDRKWIKCANCNVLCHPALNHACPHFIKHTDTYNTKHPKNTYKYYPMTASKTWELLDEESLYKTPTAMPLECARQLRGMFGCIEPLGNIQDSTNSWLLTDSDGPWKPKCKWVQSTNVMAQLWMDPFLMQLNLPATENSTPVNSEETTQPTQWIRSMPCHMTMHIL